MLRDSSDPEAERFDPSARQPFAAGSMIKRVRGDFQAANIGGGSKILAAIRFRCSIKLRLTIDFRGLLRIRRRRRPCLQLSAPGEKGGGCSLRAAGSYRRCRRITERDPHDTVRQPGRCTDAGLACDRSAQRARLIDDGTSSRFARQQLNRFASLRKRPGREILAMTINRVPKLDAIHVCFVP